MRKKGRIQGSLTVEAALVCPMLCLVLCGMIQLTMELYKRVEVYSKEVMADVEQGSSASELVRLEAVVAETLEEVK